MHCTEFCTMSRLKRFLLILYQQYYQILNTPPNEFGYTEVVSHPNIYIPPWLIVDESSDESIRNGLKKWSSYPGKQNYILNFRGSIIRQLAFSFLIGYKQIYISGLNPVDPGYWYTNQILRRKYMKPYIFNRCDSICDSFGRLLRQVDKISATESVLYSYDNTYFTFHRSIIFMTIYLSRVFHRQQVFLMHQILLLKKCFKSLMD